MNLNEPGPLGSRYHLESRIGRGGMGEVWRGRDQDGAPRAFKLLLPQFAEDREIVSRFIAERHLLTSVRHPNVVEIHDLVVEGATLAIVMELVSGIDLREYIRQHGTLLPAEACELGAQLLRGLAAIHAQRIAHRDVKPENALLDLTGPSPVVKLGDFGVARLTEDGPTVAQHTALAGTPRYMAPELLNGELPTPQSDLYSFGIVLYEMLAGVTPFAGMSTAAVVGAQLNFDPGYLPGLDDRLWSLILYLMRKDPTERPPNAATVADHLTQLGAQLRGRPALPPLTTAPDPVRARSSVPPAGKPTPNTIREPRPPAVTGPEPAPPPAAGHSTPGGFPPPAGYPAPGGFPSPAGHPPPGYPTPAGYSGGPAPPHAYAPVSHPAAAQYGPPPQYEPEPSGRRAPVLIGIVAGLLLVVGGLVAFLVFNRPGADQTVTTTADSPSQSVPQREDTSPEARTPRDEPADTPSEPPGTPPNPPGTPSNPPSPPPTPTPNPTDTMNVPEPVWPPEGTTQCSVATIAVNQVTSCEFAQNVAEAYRAHGGPGVISAYSPVTDLWYDMSCDLWQYPRVAKCTGGNNAEVFIHQ